MRNLSKKLSAGILSLMIACSGLSSVSTVHADDTNPSGDTSTPAATEPADQENTENQAESTQEPDTVTPSASPESSEQPEDQNNEQTAPAKQDIQYAASEASAPAEVTVKTVPADAKKPVILNTGNQSDPDSALTDLISQYGLSNIGHYQFNYCSSSSGWMNANSSYYGTYNLTTEFSGFSHVLPEIENNHCYHADSNSSYYSYRNSSGSFLKDDAEGDENLRIVKAYLVVEYSNYNDQNNINLPVTLVYGGADPKSKPSKNGLTETESNTREFYMDYFQPRNDGLRPNSLGWTDVTDFVRKNGYGWYYCVNIPTELFEGGGNTSGLDASADWKIVVVEEDTNESIPVRYITLKAGSVVTEGINNSLTVKTGGDGFRVKNSDNVTGQVLYNFSNIDDPGAGQYVGISSNGTDYTELNIGNRSEHTLSNLKSRNTKPLTMDYQYDSEDYSDTTRYQCDGHDRVGDDIELLDLDSRNNNGITFQKQSDQISVKFMPGDYWLVLNLLGYAVDVDISDEGVNIQNNKTFTQDYSSVDSSYAKGYSDGGKTIEVTGDAATYPKDNSGTGADTQSYIQDGKLVLSVDSRYEVIPGSIRADFYENGKLSGSKAEPTVNSDANTITIPYGKGDAATTVDYDQLKYSFLIKAKDSTAAVSQGAVENSAALSGVPYNNDTKLADAYYRYKASDTRFDLTVDPGKASYSGSKTVTDMNPGESSSLSNPVPADKNYEFVGWKNVKGGYLSSVNDQMLDDNYVETAGTDTFAMGLQDTTLQAVYRHKPITVTKVWDDDNDKNHKRPDQVTVHLLVNGKEYGEPLVLSSENNWKGSFELEPSEGNQNTYSVKEDPVKDYGITVVTGDDGKGFTITNTYGSKKSTVEPKTSDSTGIYGWCVVFAAAVIVLAVNLYARKKDHSR